MNYNAPGPAAGTGTTTPVLVVDAQLWMGGRAFEGIKFPAPVPGPGEALARIDLATVCGSDVHTVSGRRPGPHPSILGHEAVGRIAALGAGGLKDFTGRELAIGDRIVWSVTVSCGACDRCVAGMTAKCRKLMKTGHEPYAGTWALSGSYASHILLPQGAALVRVPPSISDAAAAPAACAAATVMAALEAAGPLERKRVLISGAGMLGIVACAVARSRGAAAVEVRDVNADRLAQASAFGATAAVLVGDADAARTFEVAVELSGAQPGVTTALAALDVGGRLVLAGSVSPGPAIAVDPERMVRSLLTISGVHNYEARHLQEAVDFLAMTRDIYPWDGLIEAPRPLPELSRLVQQPAGRYLRRSVAPNS